MVELFEKDKMVSVEQIISGTGYLKGDVTLSKLLPGKPTAALSYSERSSSFRIAKQQTISGRIPSIYPISESLSALSMILRISKF